MHMMIAFGSKGGAQAMMHAHHVHHIHEQTTVCHCPGGNRKSMGNHCEIVTMLYLLTKILLLSKMIILKVI